MSVEYLLKESDSIVSKTDLKGIITYVNEDFLRISGFTKNELIDATHNIVRHPDMPPEAFADMWKALKEGRPWTGMVKNRCKNGDYYWVLANATPFYENEQLAGYLSVRSKPSREQIDGANAVYQLFKENKASHLKIQDGKIVKTTFFWKLNPFKNPTIKSRLLSIIGLLCLFMLTIGGMGYYGMDKANEGLRTVYLDRTIPMAQLAAIQKLILINRIYITAALTTPTSEVIDKNTGEMEQNIAEITRIWGEYMSTYLTSEEEGLAAKFAADRKRFVTEGLEPTIAALRAKDITLSENLITHKIWPLYEPVGDGIQRLLQLQVDVSKQEFEASQTRFDSFRSLSIGVIVIAIGLAVFLGLFLVNSIVRLLDQTVAKIVKGNYSTPIEIKRQDELGKALNAIKSMQIKLSFALEESKIMANENLRIKIALDNVSTGAMIADNARNIIYVNKSVVQILSKAEADIRKQLPDFSVANLVGTNIDRFHANPAHQAKLLSTLNSNYTAKYVF